MANPRLSGYPGLNPRSFPYRVTPDLVHDYEYNLRNALSRLNNDPLLRAEDRKLVLAFLAHIKAQGVSTGRQAKYANMLRTASRMLRLPWRKPGGRTSRTS